MVQIPELKSLAKVAIGLAITITGTRTYLMYRVEKQIKSSEFYTQSLHILKSHKGIEHYLGKPILDGTLNLSDRSNNFCTETEAKFEVPIKGSKKIGKFYLWASREKNQNPWQIDRLELGVIDEPDKRILVLDSKKKS